MIVSYALVFFMSWPSPEQPPIVIHGYALELDCNASAQSVKERFELGTARWWCVDYLQDAPAIQVLAPPKVKKPPVKKNVYRKKSIAKPRAKTVMAPKPMNEIIRDMLKGKANPNGRSMND